MPLQARPRLAHFPLAEDLAGRMDINMDTLLSRITIDPAICHGQPTFLGTRILVADVLEQVASGIAWDTIVEEWRGNVSSDAISEAVRLARQAFRDHSDQYTAPEYVLERAQA